MKKIAIITPFLAQGGLEKVAVTGATELAKHFDVSLIVYDTFQVDYPYDGKIVDLKVPFYGLTPAKRMWSIVKIAYKLSTLKKKEKYDLLIVHGELANIPAVMSGKGKHIVVMHENRYAAKKNALSRLFSLVNKYIYRANNTVKIVTVSEGIRQSVLKHLKLDEKFVMTIHNPYDIKAIQQMSKESISSAYKDVFDYKVITIAARLSEPKGHKYFLPIFKKVLKEKKDIKLLILGDGELENELINLAETLGLRSYTQKENKLFDPRSFDVFFMGFQKNPFHYIAHSELFLMPSLWEGFGNTIVESMACGTTVLSSDCPSGPAEIIAPKIDRVIDEITFAKYGVLIPPFHIEDEVQLQKDQEQWIDALCTVLDDKSKLSLYETIGLKRAEDFDKKNIMKVWITLVEEITC